MVVSDKLFGWLCFAVILTTLAVMAVGFAMPLQNDEVNWLIQNDRAWLDGGNIITLYPQCGKDVFSRPLPWIWYIPAFFNYLTYGQIDHPIWVRVGGMAQFGVWLAVFVAIAMKLFAIPRGKWWMALAVMLAALGMDALPLVFLVNRPEQPLLAGIGIYVLLALYADSLRGKGFLRVLATAAFFITVLAVHAAHQKSAALVVLELAMTGVFLQRAWNARIFTALGMMAVAFVMVDSYAVSVDHLQCPGSAETRAYLDVQYLPVQMAWKDPAGFFSAALENVKLSLATELYLHKDNDLEPVWIPPSLKPLGALPQSAVNALDMAAWFAYLICLIGAVGIFCYQAYVSLARRRDGAFTGQQGVLRLALGGLMAFIAALFMLMHEAIYYVAALGVPLVVLCALLAARLQWSGVPWENAWLRRFAALWLLAAIASQGLLLYRYGDFTGPARDYEALAFDHRYFSPTLAAAKPERDIRALAAQCRIGTDAATQHVVVDDLTYTVFHATREPLFFANSTLMCCAPFRPKPPAPGAEWFDLTGYLRLLEAYGSDGIIGRCSLFPDPLRAIATEREGLCCVPKAAFAPR